MRASAYTRAANCFALARSTTFMPERDTAIARGTAIAEAAGLHLDLFDIPGRERSTVRSKPSGRTGGCHAPEEYSVDDIGDLMRAHRRHMQEGGFADREARQWGATCAG